MELDTFKINCRAVMPECKFIAHTFKPVVTAYIDKTAVARWIGVYDIPTLRAWMKDEMRCDEMTDREFVKKLKKITEQF